MATTIIRHGRAKFNVGDTVQANGRCPKYILDQIRHNRKRTVVGVYYDPDQKCCHYTLGSNRWGNSMDYGWVYWFRSYQLQKPLKGRKPGRPRQKRRYHFRHPKVSVKCTATAPNQDLVGYGTKQVLEPFG